MTIEDLRRECADWLRKNGLPETCADYMANWAWRLLDRSGIGLDQIAAEKRSAP
jgi:hypothetical protein